MVALRIIKNNNFLPKSVYSYFQKNRDVYFNVILKINIIFVDYFNYISYEKKNTLCAPDWGDYDLLRLQVRGSG